MTTTTPGPADALDPDPAPTPDGGRLQLALDVDDLARSIPFYSALLGRPPAKVRPGYANFAVAEPPLKLVLLENPGSGGGLNHLGLELPDETAVETARRRVVDAGLGATEKRDVACCYARQDKFYVDDTPDAETWEVYAVTADADVLRGDDRCC